MKIDLHQIRDENLLSDLQFLLQTISYTTTNKLFLNP